MAKNWKYGMIEDLGKAALKGLFSTEFSHDDSAIEHGDEPATYASIREFEESGRIPWVTELAQIPEKFGVNEWAGNRLTFAYKRGGALPETAEESSAR